MSSRENPEFDQIVQDLKAELKQNLVDSPAYTGLQRDEWLRALYQRYAERFLSDNSRIWTTGSIMIPLSLAAFAAVPTIPCPTLIHLLVLAIASSAVITSWLVIAENHRAFQEKAWAWMVAIEETLGLQKTGPAKIRVNRLNRLLTFSGAVQGMRWLLTIALLSGWVLVLAFWPRCP